jgi:hypothetical protein
MGHVKYGKYEKKRNIWEIKELREIWEKKKGKRKEMEKWDNENGKENKKKWENKGKGK